MNQPRIRIPRSARPGEVFEIRTLIEHPMETGLRQEGGRPVPRNMIRRLEVTLDGAPLLTASLRNGTAANPYHVFFVRLERSGEFSFVWTDEAGRTARATHRVTVA
jgi:sulfur-oxidizing protein SoxZ